MTSRTIAPAPLERLVEELAQALRDMTAKEALDHVRAAAEVAMRALARAEALASAVVRLQARITDMESRR